MRARVAPLMLFAAVAGGCGGNADRAAVEPPPLTAASSCADWADAGAAQRREVADTLKRGSQTATERERQIDRACRRFGAETTLADAVDRLARDQHTRG